MSVALTADAAQCMALGVRLLTDKKFAILFVHEMYLIDHPLCVCLNKGNLLISLCI